MPLIENTADFGAAIRAERRNQGLTQSELADCCGVGINFVSDVERGKPTVEMGRALRLSQMLGLDVRIERRGL